MLTNTLLLQQGRYRIVETLRQYETGCVYRAVDTANDSGVLIKEFISNSGKVMTAAVLEARRSEFARKAELLVSLRNDSILEVKDFFTEIDRNYLVTESVEGATLGELLDRNKRPFPLNEVARWTDRLLDAVIYLHAAEPQVVHGGIKPSTVRLAADGAVKLLIFNLADETPEKSDAAAAKAFDAGAIPYMPLEQIWGGLDPASQKVILTNFDERSERILELPVDSRGDLYSVAATAYHLLTARIPADALTRSIEILEGGDDPLKPPHSINPAIPIEVSDVLMTALELRRENRFETATEMRDMWRSTLKQAHERALRAKAGLNAPETAPATKPETVTAGTDSIAPKGNELESEQSKQLELIKAQLREAEMLRLEAEQRAADAERRLRRAEKLAAFVPLDVDEAHVTETANAPIKDSEILSETDREMVAEFDSDEFPGLFSQNRKENSGVMRFVAVSAVVLFLAIGGFAVWQFTQPAADSDPGSADAINNVVLPLPTPEIASPPIAETAPVVDVPATDETKSTTPSDVPSENDDKQVPAVDPKQTSPAAKPKSAVPQTAQVKKPAPTPAKPQPQKKSVTLDDLLKDN